MVPVPVPVPVVVVVVGAGVPVPVVVGTGVGAPVAIPGEVPIVGACPGSDPFSELPSSVPVPVAPGIVPVALGAVPWLAAEALMVDSSLSPPHADAATVALSANRAARFNPARGRATAALRLAALVRTEEPQNGQAASPTRT
jgi:hypothetical protein